jgi:tRNA/tmRNA/rRNA uracil-C5-methylase (TrmA/RlmC/RlmD family)
MHELGEGKSPYHDRDSIFVWRAKFTLEHYQDKKFTGGFFQQHDAKYPRSCLTLDYTPETFNEVLDRFCAWMDRAYDTDYVTINKMIVRTFPGKEAQPCRASSPSRTRSSSCANANGRARKPVRTSMGLICNVSPFSPLRDTPRHAPHPAWARRPSFGGVRLHLACYFPCSMNAGLRRANS